MSYFSEEWDPSTVEALWDLVSDKVLRIRVQNLQNQVYGVVLQLEEGHDVININEKLVEMGLAIRDQHGKKLELALGVFSVSRTVF